MYDIPKNLKLFRIVRRSKARQQESIERQRDLTDSVVKHSEASIYDELVLDDHSATLGQQWEHYYNIIYRKKNGEAFDGVLASAYDRVGRTQDDCEQFYLALKRAKLVLVTHKEGMLSGKNKWVMRQAAAASNEAYAASISVNMNSGIMSLIKRGVIPHTNVPLFATDKLFMSSQTRKPVFRLRWLRDGSVLKLDPHEPDAENPLAIYMGPTRNDFPRRQKDELAMLVPGDPDDVETIRNIFEMRYLEGCGYSEIADRLTARGITSPHGKKWEFYSVKAILTNEAYTGVGTCCTQGTGAHSLRHKDGPKNFDEVRTGEEDELGRVRTKPEMIIRPIEDWYVTRCPRLRTILPVHVRRRAKAWNRRDRRTPMSQVRSEGLRRSDFFLSGVLRTPCGARLWGIRTESSGKTYRKYYVDRTKKSDAMKVSTFTSTIAAPMVEGAFVNVLKRVLLTDGGLRKRVERLVEEAMSQNRPSGDQKLDELRKERVEKEEQLKSILARNARSQRLMADDIEKLEVRLEELDKAIGSTSKSAVLDPRTAPEIVNAVMAHLEAEGKALADANPRTLRRLGTLLLESATFDGFTKRVTFNLRLPRLILTAPEMLDNHWLVANSSLERGNGNLPTQNLPFGSFSYEFSLGKRGTPAAIWPIGDETSSDQSKAA